jgi:hypothetical protein
LNLNLKLSSSFQAVNLIVIFSVMSISNSSWIQEWALN